MVMNEASQRDIQAIDAIAAIPHIMQILATSLGLRFICVARVTEQAWTMCAVLDNAEFRLSPGDSLDIETTFCRTVRAREKEIVINHASADNQYSDNPIPTMYGFESSAKKGGLGLGWFIASEIAKAHQGKLSVSSDFTGTEFTFRFPLTRLTPHLYESVSHSL